MLSLARSVGIAAVAALMFGSAAMGQAANGAHRLALQINESDIGKMNAVLDIAANVSRHYSGIGQEVEIDIVAFGDGVHMLRPDTSPVRKRLANFMQSMVNVTFSACGNTLDTMERAEGIRPRLFDGTVVVQTGVAHLMELHESGWTVIRP